jgi:Winged helix DNA-binding domain
MSVVGAMAGAQAQVVSAAQISLWARVRRLRIDDVRAAIRDRALVKAWCMRRTLHLVPAGDLCIFIRGTARRAAREIQWMRGQGVGEQTLDELIAAAVRALHRPVTGRDLIEQVSSSLEVPLRMVRGGGWGSRAMVPGVGLGRLTIPVRYLLHLVGARAAVCSGPASGQDPTFVRADIWIPGWRDVPAADAETALLRRYLRAFGPATPADFAGWTGMALRHAREIWAREEANMAPVSVDGWSAAVLSDDLPRLKTASDPPPVRLLPYFDSFLLGHRRREHLVSARHHPRVYRAQGWITPVLLVDGRVAGVWAHAQDGSRLRVRVTGFGPVSRRVAAGIRDEADDLGRFLGLQNVEVQIARDRP